MTSAVGEAEEVGKEAADLERSEGSGEGGGKEVGGLAEQPVVCGSPDLVPGGRSDGGVLRDPPQGWKEEKVVLPPGTDKTGPDFRPVTVISPDMLAALAAAGEESRGGEEGVPIIASSVEGGGGDEAAGVSDPSLPLPLQEGVEGGSGEGGGGPSLVGKRRKAIPKPSHRTYIPTPVGVRLVTSGYSGVHEQLRKLSFVREGGSGATASSGNTASSDALEWERNSSAGEIEPELELEPGPEQDLALEPGCGREIEPEFGVEIREGEGGMGEEI